MTATSVASVLPTTHALDALFNPRTVVIIGASADPTKRGYRAIKALLCRAFGGQSGGFGVS